ncbi:uncharacterized protein L201_002431 [Kwoniella dendrophila CBS 6074]|uniref:Uncharacterized protein n=1 Tax=Kwoniella dendrophila CBS 6074 TaxID=1295534 RepID=A0AAX4JQ60_9TREE
MSAYFACDAFAIAPAPYYTPSLPALTPDTPSKSLPSSTPPDHYSNNDQTLIDDVEQQNHHEQDVPQKDFDDLVKWLTAHEKEFPQYPVSDVDDP